MYVHCSEVATLKGANNKKFCKILLPAPTLLTNSVEQYPCHVTNLAETPLFPSSSVQPNLISQFEGPLHHQGSIYWSKNLISPLTLRKCLPDTSTIGAVVTRAMLRT
jgi:hypothetical protein